MKKSISSILLMAFLFLYGCKKEEPATIPVLSTAPATNITTSTATSGGTIANDGGASITTNGVCWGTTDNPTINDSKTNDGVHTGQFVSNIIGLTGGTTYHVRAYATNSVGTAYGADMTFLTLGEAPACLTQAATTITATGATLNGTVNPNDLSTTVTFEYGASTSYGSTATASQSPVTGNTIVNVSANISGLISGTTYHFKVKAVNSVGTTYGSDMSFTTLNIPTLSTTIASSILYNSAKSGGNITSDGGAIITARGVCWNTTGNPTVTDSKTNDGSGTGAFVSSITGLTAGTTYYVKAYSTNSIGTAYGNQVSFNTMPLKVSDVEGNIYNLVLIGAQVWMKENLKTTKYNDGAAIPNVTDNTAWGGLTTPAYSWYNNDIANKDVYGSLYNWYTVDATSNGGKNVCPTGWHVPSDAEWTTLTTYLGGESVAGGKLKETGTTHWTTPNTGATNEIGFTALPGGGRVSDGTFYLVGGIGLWWSYTEYSTMFAWGRNMSFCNTVLDRFDTDKHNGFSVRCLRDY